MHSPTGGKGRSTRSFAAATVPPSQTTSDREALDEIANRLDGSEWTADDAEAVAGIVRSTGRVAREIDELPEEERP